MKKVKWGIISTGRIAHDFASDFQYVENAELVAVASRSGEKSRQFADRFRISKAYSSYEALYIDSDVDAIYVATPHNFHFQNSIDALGAGKAVLCEKPLTVNLQEFEQLVSFAHNSKRYLMEGMWTYFLPAIRKAQEWIAAGRIGEVKQVKAEFGYPVPFDPKGRMYNPELAGGSLLDMGIYPIAMAWLFIPKVPQDIKVVSRKAKTEVDLDVTMLFDYGDEVANLASSFRHKLFNHLFIVGTQGFIQVPNFWKADECILYEEDTEIDRFQDGRKSIGFNFELEAMSADILNGRQQSSIMPHAHSRRFQELIQRVSDQF